MVRFKVGLVVLVVGAAILLSLQAVKRLGVEANVPAILPLPVLLQAGQGTFSLLPATRIVADPAEPTGEWLAEQLRASTGYPLPLSASASASGELEREQRSPKRSADQITFTRDGSDTGLGAEGYELQVAPDHVLVRANSSAGLFYGAQTLLQLFPPRIFSKQLVKQREWRVPCIRIRDQPRFRWRGFMLDVSRHFFSPSEIRQVLNTMALHKLNVFHWHLTDDQGWRIEIKRYPRLTSVGAWRKGIGFNLDPKASAAYDAAGRYGGYYSQAEIRELVTYAQARYITIVPEIDMPGHSTAALAAYTQFSCSGGPYFTEMSENVSAGVLCPGKDETFEFVENILTEVMDLFPGEFVHLGGDEVPKENWRKCQRCQARVAQEGLTGEHQLESYFIRRIEKSLNAHGKRLVGWSEIQDDQLAQSSVLMDWIGGGVEAARTGHDVVMCPEDYCYLDFYQSKDRSTEPPAAGAYLPLEKVYSFEPMPGNLNPEQQNHLLGAQGNLWTEYIPSRNQLEYMAFPRLSALAEVVWSPKGSKNWEDFTRRLAVQEQRLDQLGVNYRR